MERCAVRTVARSEEQRKNKVEGRKTVVPRHKLVGALRRAPQIRPPRSRSSSFPASPASWPILLLPSTRAIRRCALWHREYRGVFDGYRAWIGGFAMTRVGVAVDGGAFAVVEEAVQWTYDAAACWW